MSGRLRLLVALIRRALGDRRANVAPIVAILAPTLILLGLGGADAAIGVDVKNDLQSANDAAALAVAHAVLANVNATETSLQATAQAVLNSDFRGKAPTITVFHVCAPVQKDCTMGATTLPSDTVTLQTSAQAMCTLCLSGGASKTVGASSQTTIGFSKTMQINIVMDSSASMIVGATTADVTTISNWVTANWLLVKPGDPSPYTNADDPPCAFACHDEGNSTTTADIALGLTHAHTAGATTRFDVMTSAATQLINYVASLASSNTLLAKNTYVFNVYSFDQTLHTYGASNLTSAAALTAVSSVTPGLDTWLSQDMTSLISTVGSSGTGASAASPLKFVILVTDGLQSDRNLNWENCTSWGTYAPWGFNNACLAGEYDTTISATQCQSIKNNGVVLAVLETPYVPLTGQDPNETPYEGTVRDVIYPGGPSTASTLSAALQACASNGYYYQATSSSQIATGFLQLTNQFLEHSTYISQ
jgi:Flp pilus assembly protein TadG